MVRNDPAVKRAATDAERRDAVRAVCARELAKAAKAFEAEGKYTGDRVVTELREAVTENRGACVQKDSDADTEEGDGRRRRRKRWQAGCNV